jgi:ER degradation enhancer, mannosidase alpha-like 1
VGPYSVKTGQLVYVNDSHLFLSPLHGKNDIDSDSPGKKRRASEVVLRIYLNSLSSSGPLFQLQHDIPTEAYVSASVGMFGADPSASDPEMEPIRFGHGEGVRLVKDASNPYGCEPYKQQYTGEALLVRRGECTFLEKLLEAADAGASGIVVISDEDHSITPSANADEIYAAGSAIDNVAIVVLNREDGELVAAMLHTADTFGTGTVMLAVVPATEFAAESGGEPELSAEEARQRARDTNRILYLNGHPLVNTRLMV